MFTSPIPLGEIIELDPAYDPDPTSVLGAWEEPFRQCMRRLGSGVSVVTFVHDGEIGGITATSVTSLSMKPASIVVSVRFGSSILPHLLSAGRFTVHLLAEAMQRPADAFAGRLGPGQRAQFVEMNAVPGGQRIDGALAHVDCCIAKTIPVFTHLLIVGVVENAEVGPYGRPLLYFDGSYRRLESEADSISIA
jgi:flavin reductase (DIM6/NTAB) family NADH-FMN oxidoreductase RutF